MNNDEKKLREYMKLPYTVMLQHDEEGDVIARIKELEGCVADGQDEVEALSNLLDVKALWFQTAMKAGRPIPLPERNNDLPSGKFLVRVPRSLHQSLVEIAEIEGVSLNQLVTVGLAELSGRRSAISPALRLEASASCNDSSATYGSWQNSPRRLFGFDETNTSSVDQACLHSEQTVSNLVVMQPTESAAPLRRLQEA